MIRGVFTARALREIRLVKLAETAEVAESAEILIPGSKSKVAMAMTQYIDWSWFYSSSCRQS